MKDNLIIYTHLGLGDHFIFNGLVRHVVRWGDFTKYTIVVKERNLATAKELYCDLDFVDFLVVGSDDSTQINLQKIQSDFPDSSLLMVGFFEHGDTNFDVAHYEKLNIPHQVKYDEFRMCRNEDKENECFDELYPNEKYIFVHDFCSDKTFNLNIESNLKVVKPKTADYSLMDYMKLIENAEEIHCIDSSFINMIDVSHHLNDNLFFHDIRV